MRIRLMDGRVLQGTPLQIVQQMQSLAWGDPGKMTLREYVEWSCSRAADLSGAGLVLTPAGETDEALARSFIEGLGSSGLAHVIDLN